MTRPRSKQAPESIVLFLDTKNESVAAKAFGKVEPLDFRIQHIHIAYFNNTGIMLWTPALDKLGSKDVSSYYGIKINGKDLTTVKDNKDSGVKTPTTSVYNLKGTLNGIIVRSNTTYRIEIKKACKTADSCAKIPDPATVFVSPTGQIVFSLMSNGQPLYVNDVLNKNQYWCPVQTAINVNDNA